MSVHSAKPPVRGANNSSDILISPHERYIKSIPFSAHVRREVFDPNNIEHLKSYRNFLETGNWGDVQFYAEHPKHTVPATVEYKFALCFINAQIFLAEFEEADESN